VVYLVMQLLPGWSCFPVSRYFLLSVCFVLNPQLIVFFLDNDAIGQGQRHRPALLCFPTLPLLAPPPPTPITLMVHGEQPGAAVCRLICARA